MKQSPKKRCTYAVHHGTYAGELLIYVQGDEHHYDFLSIPKMVNREIPIDKFSLGISNGILAFVEVIPTNVYKIVRAQFKKNQQKTK